MGARGKGIGKQATLAIMNYGVLTLGVDTFIVKIGYQNTPSIELFKKLGFQEACIIIIITRATIVGRIKVIHINLIF